MSTVLRNHYSVAQTSVYEMGVVVLKNWVEAVLKNWYSVVQTTPFVGGGGAAVVLKNRYK